MERMITDGPTPKHAQLRQILERRIGDELKPGDPLPGERALEDEFGVSRITVRRAIGDLVAAGKLKRVRGKGTFVAPSQLVSRTHLASLSDEMRHLNVAASSRILTSDIAVPPEEVAEFFGTDAETPHVRLRRLRLGDNEPYAIDDAWYNADHVPDLLDHDVDQSVYNVLEEIYEIVVTEAEQIVSAVPAGNTNASLLDTTATTPLLHVIRRAVSETSGGATPIEYCTSVYRTDRYRLRTRVVRALD
ncbi:GntR family transcriptional regulator [Corynebacterium glaucum]|nr:GntR family transcriptional regulator [Corynebacterium glaucum]